RSIPVPYMRRPRRRTQWPRGFKSPRLHGRFLTKSRHTVRACRFTSAWELAFRDIPEAPVKIRATPPALLPPKPSFKSDYLESARACGNRTDSLNIRLRFGLSAKHLVHFRA